jgi:thymidine kinase
MYSGKSEELIRRLRRCQIAGQHVLVVKPAIDDRYALDSVATHIGGTLPAYSVRDVADIRELLLQTPLSVDVEVIGLDEVQFMGPEVVPLLEEQANRGRRVVVAGLDLDSAGRPFGPMAELLAVADDVTKLSAVCVAHESVKGRPCGRVATRSFRIPERDTGELVQVGSAGVYEARCRVCWSRGA